MEAAELEAVEVEEQSSHSQANGERTEQAAHHTLNTEAKECTPYSTMVVSAVPEPLPSYHCGLGFSPPLPNPYTYSNSDLLSVPTFCIERICRAHAGSVRKNQKNREKLLWFCHDLSESGGLDDAGAPVSAKFYRQRLGYRDAFFRDELVRLEILEICKPAVPHVSSARYRFTIRDGIHRTPFKLRDPKLINRRGSKDEFIKSTLVGCGYPVSFLSDLKKFRPSERFEPVMNGFIKEGMKMGRNMATMEAARDKVLAGRYSLSVTDSRITNHIVGLPEQVRGTFLVEGEPVRELDFANSHACFMVKIFEPKDESPPDAIEEHRRLQSVVEAGLFYEQFMDCWEADLDMFVDYAVTKSKDKELLEASRQGFAGKDPRKGVKLCWQVLFNCKTNPNRLFNSQVWRKFGKLYPNTAARMAQYKRSNPRALGDQLRRTEALMVADVMKSFKRPCVSLYDGFLCPASEADELIEVCRKVTPKHLGFIHLPG